MKDNWFGNLFELSGAYFIPVSNLKFYVGELALIFICILVERSPEATKTTARGAG